MMGVKKPAMKAIQQQQKKLKKICSQLHKKLFEDLHKGQQNKKTISRFISTGIIKNNY